MPFLPSISEEDKVPHVLAKFNTGTGKPLLEYHEALLRGESPFTVGEREMMAAYISGINACSYCYGAHTAVATRFGIAEVIITELIEDFDAAPVDEKLRPVLAYIRKLTLTPTRMTRADADQVFAAGWDERALYDVVQIASLYNFMNRFVEGLGLSPVPEQFDREGQMIEEGGYSGMIEQFGIK